MGLLRPTHGSAELFGQDCWNHGATIRKDVGYLPGEVRFYGRMTGRAILGLFAGIRGIDCRAEIDRLSREFELELDRTVRKYSSGMRQKLGLIQAFMHRPDLLILDEPTTALDPLVRQIVHAEIRTAIADGRTVLFSSHTLSEVAELCEEVAILRDGHLIEHERVDVLRSRAVRKIELTYDGPPPSETPNDLQVSHQDQRSIHGRWLGPLAALNHWLATQSISDLTIAPPDLEDLFLAYYSKDDDSAK